MKKINCTKATVFSFKSFLIENKLFQPLLHYFTPIDFNTLNENYQNTPIQELSIEQLRQMLNHSPNITNELISNTHEYTLLKEVIASNNELNLPMPIIFKTDTKQAKKIARMYKYHYNSSYFFELIPNKKFIQNNDFFFSLAHTVVLYALIDSLPPETKLSVIVLDQLNELLNTKLMHAINEKIKDNPKLIQPNSATLIMSEECNLRCSYCYEPHQVRNNTVLTFDTAKKVLRKFSNDSKVTFFGGEPMMHVDLMKQICEWGWEYKNFRFEMVTNGQIIDRAFFRDYAKYFTYVQLSCDGPEAANDINRGHGSFKRIMAFYNAFKEETGRAPTLHPVLSKHSVPFLLDMVKWYAEIETANNTGEKAKGLRWLPGDAPTWDEETFTEYKRQLELVKNWYLENAVWNNPAFKIEAFEKAEQQILYKNNSTCTDGACETCDSNQNKQKNGSKKGPLRDNDPFCSAGKSLMAVLPTGVMVPCHHEYWCPSEERVYEEIAIDEDPSGINHMSELCMKDIPECNTCEQWGCCVCPGSFYFHSRSYVTPDPQWCRAGKMLIQTAKKYIEERNTLLQDEQNKYEYLSAGVDYLIQKEVDKLNS